MSALSVRPAACADNRWYPRDAGELRSLLSGFLSEVEDAPVPGDLMGLVSPHAGYAYAGQTAAHAYKQLEGRHYDRVVLMGPNHRAGYYPGLGPVAMTRSEYYETPLGEVELDLAAVDNLSEQFHIDFLRRDEEHSLEMQLPFLQMTLEGPWKLVPLMLSEPFYVFGREARRSVDRLSAALKTIVHDRTLMVASSDLSHLPDYEGVKHWDEQLEKLVEGYDIDRLVVFMTNEGECRACGDAGIVALLSTASGRGANHVQVLYRTNSGDVTGFRQPGQYTVGYMAAAVYRA